MDVEALVADARQRRPQPMLSRERMYAGLSAGAFLGVVAVLANVLHAGAPGNAPTIVALVLLYAVARRCLFEVGPGSAVPVQIVFVPMLFLAPLPLVPLLVALGDAIGRLPDFVLKRSHVDNWLHCFGHAWYAVGPAVVHRRWAPGAP